MITAHEALARLREGNRRFALNISGFEGSLSSARRLELAKSQEPFAIILGCSDSRVPVEFVFGQGPGDLFVVRVAGNIAAPSQVGSIELAASRFGTRLVVVLGHSSCGAIIETLEELRSPTKDPSLNLLAIIDRLSPLVGGLLETDFKDDLDALVKKAVRENVLTSVDQLRHSSQVLGELTHKSDLLIVGAEYCLETGVVDFFDEDLGSV